MYRKEIEVKSLLLTRPELSREAAFFAPGGRLAEGLLATCFIRVVPMDMRFSRKISLIRA